ncbi:MAG: lipase [Clostridia bacterium]|nr:lipase [Clostridia bacterium]
MADRAACIRGERDRGKGAVLCIGDSNTYGYDPRSFLGSRYEAGVRWTERVRAGGYAVIEDGVCGRTFPRETELPALEQRVRACCPLEAVVVLLGTNDLLRGLRAEKIASRAVALLTAVRRAAGAADVLLVAPPHLGGGWGCPGDAVRESALLPKRLRAAAQECGAAFYDAGEWGIEPAFDGIHFSEEGHRAFAARLTEALDETIAGRNVERKPALP